MQIRCARAKTHNSDGIISHWASDAFSKDPVYKFAATSLCGDLCCVACPLLPRLLANGNTMVALKLKWRRCENERETILLFFFLLRSVAILKIWWKVNTRNAESVYIQSKKCFDIVTQPTIEQQETLSCHSNKSVRVCTISLVSFYNSLFKGKESGFPTET